MRSIRASVLFALLIAVRCIDAQEAEWRGIRPLHSTHDDVERIMGPCKDSSQCLYQLKDVNVHISFSGDPCCRGAISQECKSSRWNVPRGTVIEFAVFFKSQVNLSDLKFDLRKFEKVPSMDEPDVFYYLDLDQGIQLEVIGSKVSNLSVFPQKKDYYLMCTPTAATISEPLRSGEISSKEKELLDCFVVRLKQQAGAKGLIQVRRARTSGETGIADEVVGYLKDKYSDLVDRINVTEGGFYGDGDMRLFILLPKQDPIVFPETRRAGQICP